MQNQVIIPTPKFDLSLTMNTQAFYALMKQVGSKYNLEIGFLSDGFGPRSGSLVTNLHMISDGGESGDTSNPVWDAVINTIESVILAMCCEFAEDEFIVMRHLNVIDQLEKYSPDFWIKLFNSIETALDAAVNNYGDI